MSNLYKVGGALPLDAPSYIRRQADQDLYEGLLAGEFCYVLNSRQMGKSSLRVQTMRRLQEAGIACATIDITKIGSQGITPEEWYAGVLFTLINELQLPLTVSEFEDWWEDYRLLSPVNRFSEFMDRVLLEEMAGRIVIFIDEIDSVLQLNFKDDFFAAIRACYNKRAENPEYDRLTFALLGVATPSKLIQDKNRTPFNIGRAIQLNGFQFEEARSLAQGLADKATNPEAVLQAILNWTGGQPFLSQKLCQLVLAPSGLIPDGEEEAQIEQLVQLHIIANWESQDEPEHLKTIRDRLLRHEQRKGQLIGLYQQILQAGAIPADASPAQIDLRLSGLVVDHHGSLTVYNRIYAAIFNQAWSETILASLRPYAEAISAWLASDQTDESRLLRGQALHDALGWASNKKLGDRDYEFLNASQKVDVRDVQLALDTQAEANRVLAEANQTLEDAGRKATRRLAIAGTLLGLTGLIAIGTGMWASIKASEAQATGEQARQAKLREETANSRMKTLQQDEDTTHKDLSAKQHELQQAKQNVSTAHKALAMVKQQATTQAEKVETAEQKVAKAETDQREAEKKLRQAEAKLEPIQAELDDIWRFTEGEAKRGQGKPQEALKILNQILADNFNNRFAHLSRGFIYQDQKHYRDAETEFRTVIKLDSVNVTAYYTLGDVLYDQKKLDEAIKNYKKAIELDPKQAVFYSNLGGTLSDQKKLDKATTNYRKAIALDPKYAPAYNGLGDVLYNENSLGEAITNYKKAIALDSNYAVAYNGLGNALYSQEKLDEAVTNYKKAIALDPKLAAAYSSLGYALYSQGKVDEATTNYRKAIALDPKYAPAYNGLGDVL